MESCLFIIYCLLFLFPNLFLNILQCRHIKSALNQKAVLLSSQNYQEAGIYMIQKLKMNIVQDLFNALMFAFWVYLGFKILNHYFFDTLHLQLWGSVLLVLSFLIVIQIVSLPFRFYGEMILDKRFGFSKQTNSLFFLDFFKGIVLSVLFGSIILYILAYLIENVPLWWIWGAIFVFAVMILVNFLYPTLIAPLFNTFTPLQDEELQKKIEDLLHRVGFKSEGIFVMDASKRDGRLNAYFGGFGKNKRVVLFDTLLEKVSSDGLIAILGHELGHFKHKDLISNLCIQGIFFFCIFFITGFLSQDFFVRLGLEKNSGNLLAYLILFFPIVSFWFLPLVGYFSRKAEFKADAFGVSLSSKRALIEALLRLVNENKSFPSSHPLYICFHYTHPPLLERLKALDYEI